MRERPRGRCGQRERARGRGEGAAQGERCECEGEARRHTREVGAKVRVQLECLCRGFPTAHLAAQLLHVWGQQVEERLGKQQRHAVLFRGRLQELGEVHVWGQVRGIDFAVAACDVM